MTWQPQSHLFQETKFGNFEDDVYYGAAFDPTIHAKDTPRGYPDVYVNGDDVDAVTVTIDPLKNAQWILPHNALRHSYSVHRGALKDHASVMRVKHLLDEHTAPPESYEVPTSDIDKLDFLVEREMWLANTHLDRTRFFDCSRFAGSDCR